MKKNRILLKIIELIHKNQLHKYCIFTRYYVQLPGRVPGPGFKLSFSK